MFELLKQTNYVCWTRFHDQLKVPLNIKTSFKSKIAFHTHTDFKFPFNGNVLKSI